jgi:hypothetical protein
MVVAMSAIEHILCGPACEGEGLQDISEGTAAEPAFRGLQVPSPSIVREVAHAH